MGCGSCSTGGCSTKGSSEGATKGCGGGGCATGGCNKLNSYDWFSGVAMPGIAPEEEIFEIRFKNTSKDFFRNVNGLSLITGDMVVVECERGHSVGQVSLSGMLARLQMRKKDVKDHPDNIKKIYRIATDEDIERLKKARSREYPMMVSARGMIQEMNVNMKLSDVEMQGDNTKGVFYYTADHRVDFRQLIRRFADEFRIRVEMRQIGLRFESGMVGGIGSCGRELCCSTWLTDFKIVATSAARYQNLALNPIKISGMCGRLKCCLNYELESYLDALEDIPEVNRIDTVMGPGYLQKTDIFKRIMWFSYQNEATWIPVGVNQVKEMLEMNKKGLKPESLHHGETPELRDPEKFDFVDVVGQAVLRADPKRNKRRPDRNDRRGPHGNEPGRDSRGPGNDNRPAGRGPDNRPPRGNDNRGQGGRGPEQGNRPKNQGPRPPRTGPPPRRNEPPQN